MTDARSHAGMCRADGLAIAIASSRLASAVAPWQVALAFDAGEIAPGTYQFSDAAEVAVITITKGKP